jgi:hypothetical protein
VSSYWVACPVVTAAILWIGFDNGFHTILHVLLAPLTGHLHGWVQGSSDHNPSVGRDERFGGLPDLCLLAWLVLKVSQCARAVRGFFARLGYCCNLV